MHYLSKEQLTTIDGWTTIFRYLKIFIDIYRKAKIRNLAKKLFVG